MNLTPEVQAAIDWFRAYERPFFNADEQFGFELANAVEQLAAEVERLSRISGYALKLAQDIDPGQNAWGDMIREEMKP